VVTWFFMSDGEYKSEMSEWMQYAKWVNEYKKCINARVKWSEWMQKMYKMQSEVKWMNAKMYKMQSEVKWNEWMNECKKCIKCKWSEWMQKNV